MKKTITVAYGDGIGPEITEACLSILEAAGAQIDVETIKVGEQVYLDGNSSGIRDEDWETIARNKVLLKGPITTPQGGGYKSLNVTLRKTLGLYANVRPTRALSPFVSTKHPDLDIVIIRENEEDLYGGIEHRQTPEVYQCLKLISRPGCEKIIRYAFEYCKMTGRKKVTCMTKDNIMKLTDGLFHKVFDEISEEYTDIENEHMIIDIGAARLAATPEHFDVVVAPNLYGDIISDIVAEISGSVGLAGSSNIGETVAMFEAIHGSAPLIAGQGIANPSGMLLGACQMLNHIGQGEVAGRIENAWLKTLEDGIATADIFNETASKKKVSTKEFTEEIINRLDEKPSSLKAALSVGTLAPQARAAMTPLGPVARTLEGVDIFLFCENRNPEELGQRLKDASRARNLDLQMITNRGVMVFPKWNPATFCTDHWRCRFVDPEGKAVDPAEIWTLLAELSGKDFDIIKTENLYSFGDEKGYSLGQGQ